MKIYNKFVESKNEPLNKNDIWFDGSVFRIYKEGDWIPITLTKEATERLIEYANSLYVYVIVDELPESGEEDKIYILRENIGGSSVKLEEYIWDNGWKFVDNFNSVTSVTPDWNAQADEPGYIENRTHYETAQDKTIYQNVCGYGEIYGYDDIYGVEVSIDGFYSSSAEEREVEVRFTDGIEYYTDWYELYSIPTKLVFYGSGNNPDYGYGEITGDGYEDIRKVNIFRGQSGYTEALEISNPYDVKLVCESREKPVVTPLDEKFIPKTIARKSDIATINGQTITNGGNIVIEGGTPNGVESEEIASIEPTPEFPYATKGELTELSAEVSEISERVDELGEGGSSVFWAVKGETTFNVIKEEFDNGKTVLCKAGNEVLRLSYIDTTTIYFSTLYGTIYQNYRIQASNNRWVSDTVRIDHKVESLDNGNVKLTIASKTAEVATPQYVENLLGVIINGDY